MGAGQSTGSGAQGSQALQGLKQAAGTSAGAAAGAAWRAALHSLGSLPGAKVGGAAGGFFGGAEDADPAKGLREYAASASARAKEDVIRRLARALKNAGISVDPEGDLDEIVKQLVAQIPNPRTGSKTFSSEAAAQEKICRTVADVLNNEFTPGATKAADKLIDTSMGAVEVCRSVGEWAHSFAVGVNTEFLAVQASVRNALRQITILDQIMSELYTKIRSRTEASNDPSLGRDLAPLSEVYQRAQNERRRQEIVLQNILHAHLAPAAKELEIAMKDESEQNALIKKLGLKPGTSQFADTLAMAISGLGTAASIAERVHKALKRVGVDVREYLDSPNFTKFNETLDAILGEGKIKHTDLAKFIEAVDTIRLSFGERSNPLFVEALEAAGKTGGARGGLDDDGKTPVAKRIEREQLERKTIIRDFAGRMARHYEELLAAVKAIGPKLGREVPLTDKTDALRDALARLSDMRSESQRLELALIGRYIDSDARERKERFISTLRVVSSSCAALMELEMYSASSAFFARLKAAIDSITKTIDYFADVITKKYGGVDGAADDEAALYEGGARGGDDEPALPEIARSALSLNEAVNEFAYFYYTARVVTNLEQTAAELDSYGEKYTELLGDAVAARIFSLEQERTTHIAAISAFPVVPPAVAETVHAPYKKWVNDEYDTKARFYRALQAMDLYMKAFTAAVAKDPDAMRNVKSMLDSTQVIARWYDESTGDFIWKAFENMASVNDAADAVAVPAAGAAVLAAPAAEHYYTTVGAVVGAVGSNTFGVPTAGVAAAAAADNKATAAKKAVSDAVDHFQALKNLVNAFARIGGTFSGSELHTKVFMSPTQIYRALVDFLKQSALSYNKKIAAGASAAAAATCLAVNINGAIPEYGVYFGSIGRGAEAVGNYVIENRYFALIIKAMAAKILTALGVYDMFERTSPLYDLTPTRMIVGGGAADDPEVTEGAAELYFRLPRLVEFYRAFLRWDGVSGDREVGGLRIAMIPELDGIFSGIIRLVFQKAVSPETGDYSDSEMRSLVTEVNRIYEHFVAKGEGQATKAALTAFVTEINRRYGVVKKKDMTDYWDMVKLARTGQARGLTNDTNIAILPDEDAIDAVDRLAPSDRFGVAPFARYDPATGRPIDPATGAAFDPFRNRTGLDTGGDMAKKMLRTFRTDLDTQFEKAKAAVGANAFNSVSYSLLIQQAKTEIGRATGRDDKLKVAFRLIQGTSVVGADANKALMFHETVVVGLNTLSAIETLLRNFSAPLDQMNPVTLENAIIDAWYANACGKIINADGTLGALAHAVPADLAALIGTVAARHTKYNNAGAPAFAHHLVDVLNLHSRSGLGAAATGANVATFMVNETADFVAALGALPPAVVLKDNYFPSQFAQSVDLSHTDGSLISATTFGVGDVPIGEPTKRFIRAGRLAARALVDYGAIMRDFVEHVFALSTNSQGLVEVRYTQGPQPGIQLGFAKLRSLAEDILADVKYYLEQFRPFLPKATIDRFEKSSNAGSVFWLEDHLVDTIFRGKVDASPDTLDGITRRTNAVLQGLIRQTPVSFNTATVAALTGANPGARDPALVLNANDRSRYEWYGQTFSGMVFYNAVSADSNTRLAAFAANNFAATYALGSIISTQRAATPPFVAAANDAGRFQIFDSSGGMTMHRSLMFAFNQLVARYLESLTDVAGGIRIYINLINSFANGSMSRAVAQPVGNSFPDIALAAQTFGCRADPKPQAVLFQSLAWVLQRLMKDVAPANQVPDHLVSTLTDVPLYIKEAYRANLPTFIKLFDIISQKGDFIKQLVQKIPVPLDRPDQGPIATVFGGGAPPAVDDVIAIAGAYYNTINGAQYPLGALKSLDSFQGLLSSDLMRSRLVAIIDSVTAGSYTLSDAASEVLKELGDSPVYLQTQEGSVKTYEMRYGKLPLMPLSLSLHFFNDIDHPAPAPPLAGPVSSYSDPRVFPQHPLGAPEFKMMYGHRQLLARQTPVGFEQMPGVKALLAAYNGVSAKREQLDEGRFLKYAQNIVASLRFVVDTRSYKPLVATSPRLFSAATLFRVAGPPLSDNGIVKSAGAALGTAVYALDTDIQSVLSVVENSNQDEEVSKITARVGGPAAGASAGRDMERIYNLIDMNIIPINVHALMRDIPLANLYNYEFTFEQMVTSLYGEQSSRYSTDLGDANTKNTRQMFLRLLIDPYLPVTAEMYGSDMLDLGSAGFVHRMFRGDNNLGMGRPRFLSDQLFNKALFGSVYQTRSDFDEAGPAVGIGAARGRGAHSTVLQNVAAELTRVRAAINADRTAYRALFGGGVFTLVDAVAAAAGAAAQAAARARAATWIANTGAPHIAAWGRTVAQAAAMLPNPPKAAVDAIISRITDDTNAATFAGLLAAIGAAAAGNAQDVATDALFDTGYKHDAAGSPQMLIAATLNPNTVNSVARLLEGELGARRNPGTTAPGQWRPQFGQRSGRLSYLKVTPDVNNPQDAVVSVEVPVATKQRLQLIGKARFDTTFVRNLFFITNVVRIVRLKLNRELTQSRNVLVTSHAAVAAGVTEYGTDPFGPNEVYASTYPNGQARYSDQDTY